jgi:sugar phosphate isomerase/epimerase
MQSSFRWVIGLLCVGSGLASAGDLFERSNLTAWCVVPFDRAKRRPVERAKMLKELGITRLAYDYRPEHVPTFDAEFAAMKGAGIEISAWWFPGTLTDEAKLIIGKIRQHGTKTDLWITGSAAWPKGPAAREERYVAEVARLRPIAEAAASAGLRVALYNHGGWFGEPEHQIEIIRRIGLANVGIVYNFHHGHDHLHRFRGLLAVMKPYLFALNLNGMTGNGEVRGMKIMPIGQGEWDLELLGLIQQCGWQGPIGILNHTDEDAAERLADNLAGLEWLRPQLDGKPAGTKPVPVSWKKPPVQTAVRDAAGFKGRGLATGRILLDRAEWHQRPLTIECQAKLDNAERFNILLAAGPKSSADHWELYTASRTGRLAFFQPGRGGVIDTEVAVCDGKWHHLAAQIGEESVTLFMDGKVVLTKQTPPPAKAEVGEGVAVGRLVEGGIGCDGVIDHVRLRRGLMADFDPRGEFKADGATVEMLDFESEPARSSVPEPQSFRYDAGPLNPDQWPHHQQPINRYRIYDFYSQQARVFAGVSANDLLPGFPGLEAGRFGHWGVADDADWLDDRWARSERRPVQAAVMRTPFGDYPKAVAMQLGDGEELTAFFDPVTLNFPMATGGSWVGMSGQRRGFMSGIHFNAAIGNRMEKAAEPLPGKYLGYFRHGSRLVFHYERAGKRMHDSAWANHAHFDRQTCPAGDEPLASLTKGGPTQWPQWYETKGRLGTAKPYALDTLTLPKHPGGQPWFLTGHDFMRDGTAAIATMTGEVWLLRGVDAGLGKLRWKRFASGLHQPLGLRVVDGKICVQGRDQITRLHDLNGDDEADYYECVTNAQKTSAGGHDYITGCEHDGEFFYFASANEGVCRVRPGEPVQVLGTGFRNPNGLGLAADGTVTTSVQEGDWTPTTMIHQVAGGGFYGHGGPKKDRPTQLPLAYLPRGLDNSGGGQCFIDSPRFGPLDGQMLHFSPGAANAFLVLRQELGSLRQGAVMRLAGDYLSGVQAGRINPHDGQLYVTGMIGWGSYGTQDGALQRMRYTGGEARMPVQFSVHENGVWLRLSEDLTMTDQVSKQCFAQC